MLKDIELCWSFALILNIFSSGQLKRSWTGASYLHWFLYFLFFPSKEMHRSAKLLHTNGHTTANSFFVLILRVFSPRRGVFFFFFVYTSYLEHLQLSCIQKKTNQFKKKKINQFVFFVLVQLKKFCHDLRVWTAPCRCSRGITVRTHNKKRNKPLHSFVVM